MITRKKLESLVYKHTHKDFKGKIDGNRTILVGTPEGTCLVFLSSLTDEQLWSRVPQKVKDLL